MPKKRKKDKTTPIYRRMRKNGVPPRIAKKIARTSKNKS